MQVQIWCTVHIGCIVHVIKQSLSHSHLGNSSTMNLDVEWKPLAVLDTLKPGQLPTRSEILCNPLEMGRSPDDVHTPVKVVGAKIL